MSDKIHQLLLQLNNNATKDGTELRRQINKLKNYISKRLKELETALADQLADAASMLLMPRSKPKGPLKSVRLLCVLNGS